MKKFIWRMFETFVITLFWTTLLLLPANYVATFNPTTSIVTTAAVVATLPYLIVLIAVYHTVVGVVKHKHLEFDEILDAFSFATTASLLFTAVCIAPGATMITLHELVGNGYLNGIAMITMAIAVSLVVQFLTLTFFMLSWERVVR